MSTIGKNLKKLREIKGVSQDRLSKMADVSLNTIAKLELEQSPNPTIETLQKLAKALSVNVSEIIDK
jgi:transcriptional regulator with XRE-family HTH domain